MDAEQGWLSDSSMDGTELDSDFSSEISEDWYDYDEEYYEEDDDWYEYLYALFYGESDDESDDEEESKLPETD